MIQQKYCVCTGTGHVIKSSPSLSGVERLIFSLHIEKIQYFS